MKHIPYELDPPLALRAEIGPWPDCTGPEIYAFTIHLLLDNRTDIQAESPLLLLPQLGLDIRPHPPMTIKPAMSGPRKLLACSAMTSLQIAPLGSLEACAIMFSYDKSSGAFSLTRNESRQVGADMGNFRISCATGAANFPLRRVELQVLGDSLRSAIESVFSNRRAQPRRAPDAVTVALSA